MKKFLLVLPIAYLIGCSAIQENDISSSKTKNDVYVFDDVSSTDTTTTAAKEVVEPVSVKIEDSLPSTIQFYIVQVGAFSTQKKAEKFVSEVKDKLEQELNIHKNDNTGFYVVQLNPFRTRKDAEKVRDELKQIKEFSGAWIVAPSNNK